jgi:hypothetical protein
MIGYLSITGLDLAILLNFKSTRLSWKSVVRQDKPDGNSSPDLQS